MTSNDSTNEETKMKKLFAVVLFFFTCAVSQAADSCLYGGLGYSGMTYKEKGFEDAKPKSFDLIGGCNLSSWFAVEGLLGYGSEAGEVDVGPNIGVPYPVMVDVRVEEKIGLYGKLQTSFGPVSPYLKAGWTTIGVHVRSGGGASGGNHDEATDSGFSYGGGLTFGNDWAVRVEWMRLIPENNGVEIDATSFAVLKNF